LHSCTATALRLIKPGKHVSDVAPKLAACVEPFGVNLVEGVMSHIMKQAVIDGNKVILNRWVCFLCVCVWWGPK
jgi:methionyl aminopeptidase